MKTLIRFALSLLLMFIQTATYADPKPAFDKLKSLAGVWEGKMTTNPVMKEVEGTTTTVILRVTSMGNALMHEIKSSVRPDDPITMFYLDNDRLLLTHYCDAGNRPRMTGTLKDDRTVEFAFLDVVGPLKYGHMDHAVFTFVDADHHVEEWTYMTPGDKPVHARVELTRTR